MFSKLIPLAFALAMGASASANADALADIKAHGKLTVGVEAGGTGAILAQDASGKVVGLDADINAMIAKKLGVELEMVPTAWPGIIPALLSARFDMILSGMTATKARAEKVNFTTPYGDASLSATTLAANDKVKSADDLPGTTVGVLLGTNTIDFSKAYSAKLVAAGKPALTIKTYDDIPSMFLDLTNKNIDEIMLPRPIAGGYAAAHPGVFKTFGGLGDKSYFSAAIRKEDTSLLDAVNAILTQAKSDGTIATLQTKWLGEPSGPLPATWDQN
jgi:ABC-type amino acid transport substrate-binding protein